MIMPKRQQTSGSELIESSRYELQILNPSAQVQNEINIGTGFCDFTLTTTFRYESLRLIQDLHLFLSAPTIFSFTIIILLYRPSKFRLITASHYTRLD